MATIENTIKALQTNFEALTKISASLERNPTDPNLLDAQSNMNKAIWNALEKMLREPPHFVGYEDALKTFHRVAPYNKSVFIMTKFPEPLKGQRRAKDGPRNKALNRIIETVRDSVQRCGFTPRIASEKPSYRDTIWGNIEVHLLGCSRGIAVVEDRYLQEFNPNVALEWGWMRSTGKNVLYLRESGFKKERADIMGFDAVEFLWDDPKKHIPLAVKQWLLGRKGAHR